jgi:hypothetical protein
MTMYASKQRLRRRLRRRSRYLVDAQRRLEINLQLFVLSSRLTYVY